MGQNQEERRNEIQLSPEGIDAEIRVWESIKSCNYSERSVIFNRNVNVDNVLIQLYKAKKERKLVELKTYSLYVNYMTEEEKREMQRKVLNNPNNN